MRIIHVTPTFFPVIGGIETFLYNLCRYGARVFGDEHEVIHLVAERRSFAAERFNEVNVLRSPTKHYFGVLHWPPDLSPYLADCDLLHIHDFRMLGITLSAVVHGYGKPMVLSTHGGFFHTGRLGGAKRLYYRTLLPSVIRRYDHIIASSPNDHEKLRKLHPRVTRIDNGIDFDDFASVDRVIDGDNSFVYIGRFTYAVNKRIDRLLETFAALTRRHVPFKLTLVGPASPEVSDAAAAIARHGIGDKVSVQIDLPQDALKAVLAGASYVVTATEYEGFGLSAIEGMAAGRIPLLSRIKPFTDYIRDGDNGFIIDFSEPETAAAQIDAVLALDLDAKRHIARRAQDFAAGFSWNARIREFRQCYQLAIDHRHRQAGRSGPGRRLLYR